MSETGSAPPSQWFIYQNNERLGPFTTDDVIQKMRQGQILADAYAFAEGFSDWTPLSEIAAFSSAPVTPTETTTELPTVERRESTQESAFSSTRTPAPTGEHPGIDVPEARWSLYKNGQALGPYTEDEVLGQLREGSLKPQDFIWQEGWPDWKVISDTDEWKGHLEREGLLRKRQPTAAGAIQTPTISGTATGSYTQRQFIDSDEQEGRSLVRSALRPVLVLVLIGLLGYGGYHYRAELLPYVSQIKERISPTAPPATPPVAAPAPTMAKTITPNAPTAPNTPPPLAPALTTGSLQELISTITDPMGFAPRSAFADRAVAVVKHPAGTYLWIAYSTTAPLFATGIIEGDEGVDLISLPQLGPTELRLFDVTRPGSAAVAAQGMITIVTQAQPKNLLPLPARAGTLKEDLQAHQRLHKKLLATAKKLPLWTKQQSLLWEQLGGSARKARRCLSEMHLPKACAHYSQLVRDSVDFYRAQVLSLLKTPPKLVQARLGRLPAAVLKSYAQTLKQLEQDLDAPQAVEQVEEKDLLTWAKNVTNWNAMLLSSAPGR